MSSHVPPVRFTPQGLQIPTETEVLNGVLADFNDAFGGSLNLNLETPQGQLASSLAAVIADKNNVIAELVNQIHPEYAEGVMQDAIAQIYFLQRKHATDSAVVCEFVGLPGTQIPQGFIVQDAAGNQWALQQEIGIPIGGKVNGTLIAAGQIEAHAHSVNVVYQALVGLDRVDNPHPAVPGRAEESRAEFAERRRRSVAINAHGTPQAVYANVFALDGVRDVYVIDNPKGQNVQAGATNYTLKPHSIYVAAVGGDDTAVAEAVLRYAGSGCDFNGNTEITVYDHSYNDPKPAYQVAFMRPVELSVYFRIKIERGSFVGAETAIKQAVINAFKGRIGANLYAIGYVAPVVKAVPNVHVLDVEIGLSAGSMGNSVSVGIDQTPVVRAENIEVVSV
ncbi:baseplate J/gp47 family protein [Kingella oralis]|uniref:baseplate J/gp47 family protein n=1 Tax=Kingella oralis TaxID=505 RepID=UPI00204FB14E|nr:MAG TPA: baseplate wedge protein [Caudoviricetes sp.]DAY00664.1 MAG TPA: baseplate wedge protein [Caudoviricetes sp.]